MQPSAAASHSWHVSLRQRVHGISCGSEAFRTNPNDQNQFEPIRIEQPVGTERPRLAGRGASAVGRQHSGRTSVPSPAVGLREQGSANKAAADKQCEQGSGAVGAKHRRSIRRCGRVGSRCRWSRGGRRRRGKRGRRAAHLGLAATAASAQQHASLASGGRFPHVCTCADLSPINAKAHKRPNAVDGRWPHPRLCVVSVLHIQ